MAFSLVGQPTVHLKSLLDWAHGAALEHRWPCVSVGSAARFGSAAFMSFHAPCVLSVMHSATWVTGCSDLSSLHAIGSCGPSSAITPEKAFMKSS